MMLRESDRLTFQRAGHRIAQHIAAGQRPAATAASLAGALYSQRRGR